MWESEVCCRWAFLGPEGLAACRDNNWNLQVSPRRWRSRFLGSPPRRVFSKQRAVSSADLEGLVGEVGFSRPNIFGKFALAHLRPIYKKLYAGKYYAMQLSRESRVLLFWRSIL